MAEDQSRRKSTLFRVTLVAGALLTAPLAECVARVVIADKPEFAKERDLVSGALGMLRPCSERIGHPEKVPGLKRVVVIGESSGEQLGGDLATLASATQQPTMEVLNCAVSGMTTEQVERRFDEALSLEADAIVLVFGHNVRFFEPTDERALRLTWLRSRSRLLTALSEWHAGQISVPESRTGEFSERMSRYETFINRVIAETTSRKIRLVVTTMASNLMSPPTTMPNADTDALVNARYLEASGKRSEAIDSLKIRSEAETDAAIQFEIGHLLRHARQPREARPYLAKAIETEVDPGRAPDQLNDFLRRMAASKGFSLRDTAQALLADTPDGIVGWATHTDHCHLQPRVMKGEALAVAELVAAPDVRLSPEIRAPPSSPDEFPELLPRRLAAVEYALGHVNAPVEQQYRSLALLAEECVRDHGDAAIEAERKFIATTLQASKAKARIAAELALGTGAAGKHAQGLALLDAANAGDDAAIVSARKLLSLAAENQTAAVEAKNKE